MAPRKRPKIVFIDQPDADSEQVNERGSAKSKSVNSKEGNSQSGSFQEVRTKSESPKERKSKAEKSSRRKPKVKSNAEPAADAEVPKRKTTAKERLEERKRLRALRKAEEARLLAEAEARERRKAEAPMRRRRRVALVTTIAFGVIAFVVLAAFIFIPLDERQVEKARLAALPGTCLGIQPDVDWPYQWEELTCVEGYWDEVKDLSDWLLDQGVGYRDIISLTEELNRQKLKKIAPGQTFTLLHEGNAREPKIFAYLSDPSHMVLLNLSGKVGVHLHALKVLEQEQRRETVRIEESLADAMYNREYGLKLTQQLEEALKWDVDFFHLEPGDQFILLYDIKSYEGERRELGRLAAVRYKMKGEVHHAFYFDHPYVKGYFDEDGHPMKASFLKAPLAYGRISSPYNLNRSDPFTGKIKAHLGTDYAAPMGTEILAVADGVVSHAEFKGNNGNYVKLQHQRNIQTQYLHMSKFAKGIQPGVRVRQGQVIGYVGMTGRATGPHVCFRFWKDGAQVDHRKEKGIGSQPPLSGEILEEFLVHRDSVWNLLEPI